MCNMRNCVARIGALLLFMFLSSPAQGQELSQVTSLPWQDRARLVRSVAARLASTTPVAADEGMKSDILSLLAFENALVRSLFVQGVGTSGRYGEGYSEYYSSLLEVAGVVFPQVKGPSRQAWLRELATSPHNPGSKFSDWLVSHGDEVVDILIAATTTAELDHERSNAFSDLTALVTSTSTNPVRARSIPVALSAANRIRAIATLQEGLSRLDRTSREIVWALRRDPSDEVALMLQTFAASNRGRSGFTSYRIGGSQPPLSEEVDRAIAHVRAAVAARPQ